MGSFPEEVYAAQSVVITGPPMTGEDVLFHRVLAARGNDRIVIATGQTADAFRADHDDVVGDCGKVRVVDCLTSGQGETPPEDDVTRYVDGPGNLTALGVKTTEFLSQVTDDAAVVGVNSLSQLLMHAGFDQTYQFVHILAQQTTAEDTPLIATLNTRTHEDQTVDAIHERFECFIETRTTEERNEYRVRTSMTEPSAWMAVQDAG